jgi:diguanylate cyclase (GGDEF)-like protein
MPLLHKFRILRSKPVLAILQNAHAATLNDEPEEAEIIADENGCILNLDSTAEHWFGYKSTQLSDRPLSRLTASISDNPLSTAAKELLEQGKSLFMTFRHANGHFFTGQVSLITEDDPRSQILKESIAPSPTLQSSELAENYEKEAKIGAWYMDIVNNTINWTKGVYDIFGLEPESPITPEHVLYFFHSYQHRVKAAFRRCILKGTSFSLQVEVLNTEQNPVWVRLTGHAEKQGDKIMRLTGTVQDISELRDAKLSINQMGDCLNGILDNCHDLIVSLDNQLTVTAINQSYQNAFRANFGGNINVGDNLEDKLKEYSLNTPEHHRIYLRQWLRAFEREHFEVEMPLAQRDEDLPVYKIHFSRLYNRKGEVIGASHIARDISEQVNVQDQLNYLSKHDPLTGTLNRKAFYQRLTRASQQAACRETSHALLYLDLDHFKTLNQTVGHNAGDNLLRKVSGILGNKIRDRDALARVGGNEFAILLENCQIEEAQKVAEQICDTVARYEFEWQEQRIHITVSIGISTVDSEDNSVDHLLEVTGHACYAAQVAGGNRIQIYQSTKHEDASALALSRDGIDQLQWALQNDKALELSFQSIRPVNGAVWGDHFEILTCIRKMDQTLMPPEQFLPIAEQFDIIRSFDRRVVCKVINWLNDHQQQAHRHKLCSVNLSLNTMLDPSFPDYVGHLLETSAMSSEKLCFEINETHVITHWGQAQSFINALRQLGCSMAIDRVGSAKADFSYLADLEVNFIKVDGNLIKRMEKEPIARVLVECIQKIAHLTGKQTIAEFVENQAALRDVRKLGLDFGQGYGIAKPKPMDEMAA